MKIKPQRFTQLLILASSLIHSSCSETNDSKACELKVQNGECNSNPIYMLKNCRQECFDNDEFGTIGYFQEEVDEEVKRKANLRCIDIHEEDEDSDSCDEYAEIGECAANPGFMLFRCAKSCLVCIEPGKETFPIGKRQEIHPEDIGNEDSIEKTSKVIIETYSYMEQIMTQPDYASIRTICQNNDEYCAALAADGGCEIPNNYDELQEDDEEAELYEFMISECAPACQTCENLISEEDSLIVKDCIPDSKTNIFGPGDLNRMFERIVGESDDGYALVPKEDVNILSRPSHPKNFKGNDDDPTDYVIGPWVVTLSNFLTDEECDRLIHYGSKIGFKRSTLQEEDEYDEDEKERERNGEDAYRTSTNTWCKNECYRDTLVQRVLGKLTNATGIPDSYAEHLQLLSYIPGQYYKPHHDISGEEFYQPSGSRILTFFLYLNDVEEGGSTRMTDLTGDNGGISVDVQPKKGMALIWPSVMNEDPLIMDDRTFHEALTVVKGRKFGANAWFYIRNLKDDECDYDALNLLRENESEDNDSPEESKENSYDDISSEL